ncbi:coiled-coil domain-containing protein 130 homolog isoform X2 [Copidosoma floridanum]|uniref:coiled-coil domain-containing protein 130 homolog isoform X2 n=1 Tax=Copidosoma floridanum TaxID=29053 RepID=UPI000C6F9B7A|nr:coiled-coil domain-containing protein 130 homolog isoform X2 [Copidosoma floridanum]
MGERKGQNLYYPPDYDPKFGGINKFQGTHALRERARKLHLGILIIRFEMPFNIWCDGCGNHIGMGVRYNAEKKKVGMYYSTPVYQFRMKCHLCDNHFEIKTDPGNLDYLVISGARRQENRWDPTENEQVVPETKEVSRRLYDDAMYKLEHSLEDKKVAKTRANALESAIAVNETLWKDDYTSNCTLRSLFRDKKKEIQNKSAMNQEFLNKTGINIDLVDEHEDDIRLAKLLSQHKMKNAKNKALPLKQLVSIAQSKKNKKILLPSVPALSSPSTPSTSSCSSSKSISVTSLVHYDNTSSESDS